MRNVSILGDTKNSLEKIFLNSVYRNVLERIHKYPKRYIVFMGRTTYHISKVAKEELERLREKANLHRSRRLSQEAFLHYIAKKMKYANLEAVSFVETQFANLLKQYDVEIEILPVLIVPNEKFQLVQELYHKLYMLNFQVLYFTSDNAVILVFKSHEKQDVIIPVVS